MNSTLHRAVTAVLSVTQARKRFGDTVALDGAELELRHGEWLALLGPNGAGKTTLVRALAGRVRLDQGRLELFGRELDWRQLATRRSARELGIVPQEIALYSAAHRPREPRGLGSAPRRAEGPTRGSSLLGARLDRPRRARQRTGQAVLRAA